MRTRRRLALMGAVLLAGVGVTLTLLWRAAGHSDPVAIAEVLERFRAAPGADGAAGGPAPGVYTYRLTGRERGGAGPLAVDRTLPETAVASVTRTSGGWEWEVAYSRQHVEGGRFVVRPDAIDMVWRRVDVTFAGIGRDDRRELAGRYRLVPTAVKVGDTWSDTYEAGSLVNRVRNRVERAETVRVGGVDVPTLVIASNTVTTGTFSGTRDETLWWSPELRVPIRSRLDVVVEGLLGYESHIDMTLTELAPAR